MFRSRTRRGGGARVARKRPIWVNVPGALSFTETAGTQAIMVPEDWEVAFSGNANEQAVLRTIQGNLSYSQATTATQGVQGFAGLYIADKNATVAPTFSTTGMDDVDWLHVWNFAPQATVSSANNPMQKWDVDIRAKRRLKSRDTVYLVAQFGADGVANPSATLGFMLRLLVSPP